jgi:hypothetical protein
MADWGLKVSKPGKDVKTCTKDELVFDSELNTMKIAKFGSPTGSGNYTHGLGYIPAFMVAGDGSFLGQEFSAFALTFATTSTVFYYHNTCRYWLFYQQGA